MNKKVEIEQFVKESHYVLQEYICSICDGVYCKPTVDSCGHLFCLECIKDFVSNNQKCPISDKNLTLNELQPMKFIENILNKQKIHCLVKECEWIGAYEGLQRHLAEDCAFVEICCPNPGCEVYMRKDGIAVHVEHCNYRELGCCYCEQLISLKTQDEHLEKCGRVPVECSRCPKKILREAKERHEAAECEMRLVNCPYKPAYCETLFPSKDNERHCYLNREKHQLGMLEYVLELEKKINEFNKLMVKDRGSRGSQSKKEGSNCESAKKEGDKAVKNEEVKVNNFDKSENERLNAMKEIKSMIGPLITSIMPSISRDMTMTMTMTNKINLENVNGIENVNDNDNENNKEKETEKNETSLLNQKRLNEDPINLYESSDHIRKNPNQKDIDCTKREAIYLNSLINLNQHQNRNNNNFDSYLSNSNNRPSFNILESSFKSFKIIENRAICAVSLIHDHKFLFTNAVLNNINTNFSWKIKINKLSGWMALGCCVKDHVISNKLKFKTQNHGCFVISTNGFAFNFNSMEQDNKKIENFPKNLKNEAIFQFFYNFSNKTLQITIINEEEISYTLYNVNANKDSFLVPCIIMMKVGDEVEIIN